MLKTCETAIIGAGPYGLSLAAHLRARGVDFRIFGKPLETWREHMPKDMVLKSEGAATNLSAPSPDSTLKAWCMDNALPYDDHRIPVPLDRFLAYGDWFQKRYVPELEQANVTSLEQRDGMFVLMLDTGERLAARNVVLAVGISAFAYTPDILKALPSEVVSHSYDHRDGSAFRGRKVAIVGRGASAIDLAHHLQECGADVSVVARTPQIAFNSTPDQYDDESLLARIQNPPSGIGRGWKSLFCAAAPLLFFRLPEVLKQRAIRSHMHPAGGWFMRAKIEGKLPLMLGRSITSATMTNGCVRLHLSTAEGADEILSCDHVIAATGYRADMAKLAFIAPALQKKIGAKSGSALVSDVFETPVKGLYAVGLAAMESFGPLLRFMVGAEFVAPRLAAHLHRKAAVLDERRAA